MPMHPNESHPHLRAAIPNDAEMIYRLKREAFGAFLPFTIYRSPKSITYLRRLIAQSAGPDASLRVKVLTDGPAHGYYMAAPVGDSFFLTYIAVEASARNAGMGGALLDDFESEARRLGFKATALDVFAANRHALEWYRRRGYEQRAHSHSLRIDLGAFETSAEAISWRDADWRAALNDERDQGFAKFEARLGNAKLEVGLIDEQAVKLLTWDEIPLETAVNSVAAGMGEQRSELILTGLATASEVWPCLAHEELLRLERIIA